MSPSHRGPDPVRRPLHLAADVRARATQEARGSQRLVLTRRGRLARTILCALALLLVLLAAIGVVRSCTAAEPSAPAAGSPATPTPPATPTSTEAAPTSDPAAASAPPAEGNPAAVLTTSSSGLVGSDTAGDGTWVMAAAGPAADPAAGTVRSYALRVENGTFLDADAVAAEVEGVLPDPRGWQGLEHVVFQRVADPAQADFTISLASPPTVDRICAPARTYGKWSCREGSDVVLNTDRWLYLTPAYSDTAAYRAYMVNHEVGHYLGHGHATCPAEGVSAPVMLQQSMGLDGCRANPWPTLDGQP